MVAYESIKQGKVQLSNPKSGPGRLTERSLTRLLITKFSHSSFKRGFKKVDVTRAARLREWSQGEL